MPTGTILRMQTIYWTAWAIPFLLIGVDGAIRKLVKHKPWHWRHFHCGIDLSLAVLGAVLANFLDLSKEMTADAAKGHQAEYVSRFGWTGVGTALVLFLLLVIAGFHQDFEDEKTYKLGQVLVVLILCNFLGLMLAAGFVLMKVGRWI